jgi:hypothetical protein
MRDSATQGRPAGRAVPAPTGEAVPADSRIPGQDPTRRLRVPAGRLVARLAVRGAVGMPLALAAVPLALFGGSEPAARAQRAVVRRWGAARLPEPERSTGAARTLGHSAAVFLPSLVCFAAVALSVFVAYSGYLYGFRPDNSYGAFAHPFTADQAFDEAWGGPTLAGAWAVHALVALAIHLAAFAVTGWLTALQDKASVRLLGQGRQSARRSAQ